MPDEREPDGPWRGGEVPTRWAIAAHLIGDHENGEPCDLTAEELVAWITLERDLRS